jgi:hypothetical protein
VTEVGETTTHPLHFMYAAPPGLKSKAGTGPGQAAGPSSYTASGGGSGVGDEDGDGETAEVRAFKAKWAAAAASSSLASQADSSAGTANPRGAENAGLANAAALSLLAAATGLATNEAGGVVEGADGEGAPQGKPKPNLRAQTALEREAGLRARAAAPTNDEMVRTCGRALPWAGAAA